VTEWIQTLVFRGGNLSIAWGTGPESDGLQILR
jgi:hypothetical protein